MTGAQRNPSAAQIPRCFAAPLHRWLRPLRDEAPLQNALMPEAFRHG